MRIIGTSHVSSHSMKTIKEEMKKRPQCLAVELDYLRYLALKKGSQPGRGPLFLRILSWIQRKIGEKTGVFPGEEMLIAIEIARQEETKFFFIDLPMKKIQEKLMSIPVTEKIRLLKFSLVQFITGRYNFEKVPSQALVAESLEEFSKRCPQMHRLLVEERNNYMAERVINLSQTYEDILLVVGAGHVQGLLSILETKGLQVEIIGH